MNPSQFHIQDKIGAPILTTRFPEQALVAVPPRGTKFTIEEWRLSNDSRLRNTLDQEQLADRVLGESEKVRDEAGERSEIQRTTTERRMEERIEEVEFNKKELMNQRKEIYIELEALAMYKTRLQDCLAALEANALTVCRKCLLMREGRLGIDLVADDVDIALEQEIRTIIGGKSLLKRALEQLNEQMRRLRSTRYLIDRDLQYKQHAIDIDKGGLTLKHTDLCLSIYEGYAELDPGSIAADEYNAYSANNIREAAREVSSARPIRLYIDTLLKQVTADIKEAYEHTNHCFRQRISETQLTLEKFKKDHKLVTKKIFDMKANITDLEKALVDKEGHIGLAHTRLGRRAQRVGSELVRDQATQSLYYECELLRKSTEELQQMLYESSASLRYLLQAQIQMEEDMNVKINTLKIDEVDCMTLRATMSFHCY